jgi:hypothetical protein
MIVVLNPAAILLGGASLLVSLGAGYAFGWIDFRGP